MTKRKIIIIGAGPGGLTAGMILAHRGFDVTIFEKDEMVGGRSKPIKLGEYTFDTGPTFLMLKFILVDMFKEAGENANEHLEFKRLDPLYRLQFKDKTVYPSNDKEKNKKSIAENFPGNEQGFDKFIDLEAKRFEALYPCLQKDYSSIFAFLNPIFLKAINKLSIGRTLFGNLGTYFSDDELKLAFTFQSKYLGMSPWDCPALFTMLSYMEYDYGVYHVRGGLNNICFKMQKVFESRGGKLELNTKVQQLLMHGGKAQGVVLENGREVYADEVIINADFSYAMNNLVPLGKLKKYSKKKLEKKKYSCATFMLYLGLKKKYDLKHHNIIFADDYKANVDKIFNNQRIDDDFSFYIQNACVSDTSLAPKGKSTMYVLVPVANNRSKIDWEKEKAEFRDKVIDKIIEKTGFTDLRDNIEVEKIITPNEWENDYNVYIAAEFNLAHNLGQMLYLRPRNKFEEIDNCYLVGGGTHPGSGLPTIYESGRITANLISKKYKVKYKKPAKLPIEESLK